MQENDTKSLINNQLLFKLSVIKIFLMGSVKMGNEFFPRIDNFSFSFEQHLTYMCIVNGECINVYCNRVIHED